jgi:hypothetical protein
VSLLCVLLLSGTLIVVIIPNYYEERIQYRFSYNHKISNQRQVYDLGLTNNISYTIYTHVRGLCR